MTWRYHFLYLRSIIVGLPFRLLVSLVETLALPSIIGLVSIIRDRSIALSNWIAKSSLVTIAVTASFGCSCGNAAVAARILVINGMAALR